MENETNKTIDKPWLFKKGNPGGPGRTPGKSLKEYSREYLAKMTEEERLNFLEGLPKVDIWKMAEGSPHSTEDITSGNKPLPQPIYGGLSRHNSNKEDISVEEENSCN